MVWFRIIWRFVGVIICVITGICAVVLLALPLKLVTKKWIKIRNLISKAWAMSICKIMGLKWHVSGYIPEPPFFMVANHVSYMDILTCMSFLKCMFVAKLEIRTWPIIGLFLNYYGIMFIDRLKMKDVKRVLEEFEKNKTPYYGYIVFPEGSTSDGRDVMPFRSSLLEYPIAKKIPVHYAAIRYSVDNSKYSTDDICWADGSDNLFTHFIKILRLPSYNIHIHFGVMDTENMDRKSLTEGLHKKVSSYVMKK